MIFGSYDMINQYELFSQRMCNLEQQYVELINIKHLRILFH